MADNPETGTRDKLIRRKLEWAEAGRPPTGQSADPAKDRLPPGQREVKTWPVLDLGAQPKIDLNLWHLALDGLVENPVRLDWDAFNERSRPCDATIFVSVSSSVTCFTDHRASRRQDAPTFH